MNRLVNRFRDIEDVKKNWGWFFALGILMILLGCAVIGSSFYATMLSVMLLGIFLVVAGIVQLAQSFLARKWSGLLLLLMLGLVYIIVGFFFVTKPTITAITITLWIAAFCFIVGLFRMITALIMQFDQWGWVFFNGLVTFLLGAMIYADWPISGLWVIGLFIGIDMILAGWSWLVLSLTARE